MLRFQQRTRKTIFSRGNKKLINQKYFFNWKKNNEEFRTNNLQISAWNSVTLMLKTLWEITIFEEPIIAESDLRLWFFKTNSCLYILYWVTIAGRHCLTDQFHPIVIIQAPLGPAVQINMVSCFNWKFDIWCLKDEDVNCRVCVYLGCWNNGQTKQFFFVQFKVTILYFLQKKADRKAVLLATEYLLYYLDRATRRVRVLSGLIQPSPRIRILASFSFSH